MVKIPDTKRHMQTASDILDLTRSAALALIEREERNTGSRTAAYERVAAMVGASPSWLVKFIREERAFSTVPFNIIAQYDRLCSRVELEAQIEREKSYALREQIDAATAGALGMVAISPRAKKTGT